MIRTRVTPSAGNEYCISDNTRMKKTGELYAVKWLARNTKDDPSNASKEIFGDDFKSGTMDPRRLKEVSMSPQQFAPAIASSVEMRSGESKYCRICRTVDQHRLRSTPPSYHRSHTTPYHIAVYMTLPQISKTICSDDFMANINDTELEGCFARNFL